jgi:hypothetical protein
MLSLQVRRCFRVSDNAAHVQRAQDDMQDKELAFAAQNLSSARESHVHANWGGEQCRQ